MIYSIYFFKKTKSQLTNIEINNNKAIKRHFWYKYCNLEMDIFLNNICLR